MDPSKLRLIHCRNEMMITVLVMKEGKWETRHGRRLADALHLQTGIGSHPDYPSVLMIQGDWSKVQIAMTLGVSPEIFMHEVIKGMDNPQLPFKPPFIVWTREFVRQKALEILRKVVRVEVELTDSDTFKEIDVSGGDLLNLHFQLQNTFGSDLTSEREIRTFHTKTEKYWNEVTVGQFVEWVWKRVSALEQAAA